MAMNALPIILLAGAAFLLMRGDEEEEDTTAAPDDPSKGFGGDGTPCGEMAGIYQFRDASSPMPPLDEGGTNSDKLKTLPLSLDAFQKLRKSLIDLMDADYAATDNLTNALIAVSKAAPGGASSAGDLDCGWSVSMSRDEEVADWSTKQKAVYQAAKTLKYSIQCFNMYGVWHAPTGGNLAVTKEFFDDATARLVALKADAPSADRDAATLSVLEANLDTKNCDWRDETALSDRQKAVYNATQAIFDQVYEAA